MPPPFMPVINRVEFCSYPSEAIDGNVPIGAARSEGFGPCTLSGMLRVIETSGGGRNGNTYTRPHDSPHPELELWREI
eukprot:11134977-Alexandrium_andersonii.AAC.1